MHEVHFLSLSPVGWILWGVIAISAMIVFVGARPRLLPIWLLNAAVFGWVIALLVQGQT